MNSVRALLFGFNGRMNRAKYWLAIAINVAFMVGVGVALEASYLSPTAVSVVAAICYALMLVSGIAVVVKRLHDRNKSGLWLFLFFGVPAVLSFYMAAIFTTSWLANHVVGLAPDFARQMQGPPLVRHVLYVVYYGTLTWGFIELACLRGTRGDNRFGPDPLHAGPRTAVYGSVQT